MNAPKEFVRIVGRKRYSVATSKLLAHDSYWDGHNFERHGTNTFLYRTPRLNYFTIRLTQWQGETDSLNPCTIDEAIELYEGSLKEHEVSYEEAFPGVEIRDA